MKATAEVVAEFKRWFNSLTEEAENGNNDVIDSTVALFEVDGKYQIQLRMTRDEDDFCGLAGG